MNIFQLVLKQMRQRALGTSLTLLSVMLGAALAVSILVLYREVDDFFGQRQFGYDSLIGVKGPHLQLVLNTIYHLDKSPGNIAYSNYDDMIEGGKYYKYVKIAVPFVLGDTLNGKFPIIGTLPELFGVDDETSSKPLPADKVLAYAGDQHFELAEGGVFRYDHLEGVLGSEAARLSGLKLGDTFQATHTPATATTKADIHPEQWKVVGILKPTHTANDNAVWIPIRTFYCIAEHGVGLIQQARLRAGGSESASAGADDDNDNFTTDKDGTEHHRNYIKRPDGAIELLPKIRDAMALSGIMIQSRGGNTFEGLLYDVNNGPEIMDVNPADEMRGFLDTFLKPSQTVLLVIAFLVQFLAAASITVSIYNSVSAKIREVAILRALGATRQKILTLICLEAGLIGVVGALLGSILGHLICAVGSRIMAAKFGHGILWAKPDAWEGIYLVGLVAVAILAGLVPAMKAYKTPVATNLVAM